MVQAILTLQDSAHAIALGTAIGLFIAWTPTVGLHMILVVGLCLLFRANKVAGLIAVYVSNPITFVPMYWLDYWVGAIFLHQDLTYEELKTILSYQGWEGFKMAFWRICVELAGPMWLGGVLLAVLHAVPGYYLTLWGIARYRNKSLASIAAVGGCPPASIASQSSLGDKS
jgi:uncharacterized protein (DUF2062 family)